MSIKKAEILRPDVLKTKMFLFRFSPMLKRRSRIICSKRDIPLAMFIREALEAHCQKYEKLMGDDL